MDGNNHKVQAGKLIMYIELSLEGTLINRPILSGILVVWLVLFFITPAHGRDALPVPAGILLFRVSKLYADREYAKAARVIEKFRRENKGKDYADNEKILFALGNCYLALKDYAHAIKNYKQAVAGNPSHSPSWENMANALYNMKKYREAAKAFMHAYQILEKKRPELLYYCGVCYLMAGESHYSIRIFDKLFDDFPRDIRPAWKEGMARALIEDGQNKRALPLILELVSIYTGAEKKQWNQILLYQYLHLGMNRQALKLALSLARTYPGEARWWKAVAHVTLEQGGMEEALMALMIVSYIRPLDEDETRLLADMNLQVGIPVKALPAYEAVLAARPDPVALRYLVYACQRLGDKEKALMFLEKYKGIVRKSPVLMMCRADLLYELRRYRKALETYMHAARHKGDERGRAWLMAGYCAWQLDDLKTALYAFGKAGKFPAQKKKAIELRDYISKTLKVSCCSARSAQHPGSDPGTIKDSQKRQDFTKFRHVETVSDFKQAV